MLAKRVIPTMLVRGRTLVKGKQFAGDRSIGHAQQAARVHAMRGVDELLILDIGATPEGRGPDLDMIRELSESVFIPITVGGGVRSIDDINALLRAGADKVCIGTAAWGSDLVELAADRFGSQAIVVTVDIKGRERWIKSGAQCVSQLIKEGEHPIKRAAEGALAAVGTKGAGEIVIQAIDRDGEMTGYDLDLIEAVATMSDCPVIASGGCSGYPDMLEALKRGASGVAAGALFAFTDATPRGASQYLHDHGIPVRLETLNASTSSPASPRRLRLSPRDSA